jgi:1,4-alpha-glucan branching enzyme
MRMQPGEVPDCRPGKTLRDGSANLIKVAKPTRSGQVRVTFVLSATEPAGAVSVVGDFNHWDPYAHPLRKRSNGVRSAVVTLPAGTTLRFRYLAEGGVWFDDETATMREAQDAVVTIPG